jgi:hypothetical protein
MPMTPEEFLKLWVENEEQAPDGFTEVADSGWEQEHKTQHCETVYQETSSGRFFGVYQTRSGSYHSDWYYEDPSCCEVRPESKTTIVYRNT